MFRREILLGLGVLSAGRKALGAAQAVGGLEARIHRGRRWTCYLIDPARQTLGLFWSGDDGFPLRTFAALERWLARQRRRLIVGMNAGMFEADGSPVGWCVVEGKTVRGPQLGGGEGNFYLKPNGVFAFHGGRALVAETASMAGKLKEAVFITQSGPLLVTAGKVHPAFNKDSVNRNIRNAVGVAADGRVWLAISEEPVSFHESATFFLEELNCPDALFLDGAISRLHAPGLGRNGGGGLLGPCWQ